MGPEKTKNTVTTDASKTGLGTTLWQKQDDGNIKLTADGSIYLKYGQLFAEQSKDSKRTAEKKNGTSGRQSEN